MLNRPPSLWCLISALNQSNQYGIWPINWPSKTFPLRSHLSCWPVQTLVVCTIPNRGVYLLCMAAIEWDRRHRTASKRQLWVCSVFVWIASTLAKCIWAVHPHWLRYTVLLTFPLIVYLFYANNWPAVKQKQRQFQVSRWTRPRKRNGYITSEFLPPLGSGNCDMLTLTAPDNGFVIIDKSLVLLAVNWKCIEAKVSSRIFVQRKWA